MTKIGVMDIEVTHYESGEAQIECIFYVYKKEGVDSRWSV